MSRLFISHATADRKFVEANLLGLLRALGFDVWFAEADIRSAEHWERSILAGLRSSQWFILVMSPRSATSEWVKDEINWAIDARPQRILPILIDDCDPREFHIRLPRIQCVDFRENLQSAREQLVQLLVHSQYKSDSLANVVNALMTCPSKEILTLVRSERDGTQQQATLIGANAKANEFYGRKSGTTIAGTDLKDILAILSNWMDQHDFDAFCSEQMGLSDNLRRSEELYATIPMKINQKHPYPSIRGRKFLPIAIAYSKPEEIAGKIIEYAVIMYLDLDSVSGATAV